MKYTLFAVSVGLVLVSTVSATVVSTIQPLGEFSPAKVRLTWSAAEAIPEASYTVYCRKIADGSPSVWNPIASLISTSTTAGYYSGMQGETYQFRSALKTADISETATIADFNVNEDLNLVGFVGTQFGYSCTLKADKKEAFEGPGCLSLTFQHGSKKIPVPPPDTYIGIGFTDRIITRDWSNYRYLEFYYWGEFPEGVKVLIQSASNELLAPVEKFSETGGAIRTWHSIVVDLDQALCPPEKRKEITTLGFVIPVKFIKPKQTYTFKLDAIRLWSSRNIVQTRLDATPPTPPTNLKYKINPGTLEWSWDPAQEDLSGIAGYSYYFGLSGTTALPTTLMTKEPKAVLKYTPLPYYAVYCFKVRALNQAGMESTVTETRFESKPHPPITKP